MNRTFKTTLVQYITVSLRCEYYSSVLECSAVSCLRSFSSVTCLKRMFPVPKRHCYIQAHFLIRSFKLANNLMITIELEIHCRSPEVLFEKHLVFLENLFLVSWAAGSILPLFHSPPGCAVCETKNCSFFLCSYISVFLSLCSFKPLTWLKFY